MEPKHIYYFRIDGENKYHHYESRHEDKIDAARDWYREYIPSLCEHQLARMLSVCGDVMPGKPVVIQMTSNPETQSYSVRISFASGIRL